MSAPGTYYKASGHFEVKPYVIALLIGILISMGLGGVYSLLMFGSAFFLEILRVVIVIPFACSFIFSYIVRISQSRSPMINLGTALLLCYITWSSQWAFVALFTGSAHHFPEVVFNPSATYKVMGEHANRSSGSFLAIVYIIEFVAFMWVAAKVAQLGKIYYCENCERYYTRQGGFLHEPQADQFFQLKRDAGEHHHYQFLTQFIYAKQLKTPPKEKETVVRVEVHYCAGCYENNLLDISSFRYSKDPNYKNKSEIGQEKEIIQGMYTDKETADSLLRKFSL